MFQEQFDLDPFSGKIFLFCGGRKDRFKVLYWDGQGKDSGHSTKDLKTAK
ncbi:transposase [Lactobacillus agrestimuris]|nr:transposase [Lactobacillus agrestimuris]